MKATKTIKANKDPNLIAIENALQNLPEEKHIYFNGFTISFGSPDMVIILQRNGRPVAFLNTPHGIAKSFGEALRAIFTSFESDTNMHIMTLDEMTQTIEKGQTDENNGMAD